MVAPDRERLRRALGRRLAEGPAEEAGVRDLLRRRLLAAAPARAPVALPPGEERVGALGPFWRRELRYPLDHVHGRVPLAQAAAFDARRLAELAKEPGFAALERGECLFLDTETTGLAGGAGTVVFAFGLGWFDEAAFVLEQLFLRDFGEEAAMLAHVQRRLAEHPVPVTYVGKSFDRHRIAARLCVCRIDAPILTERHLDLFHLARRAFGRRLPDCRLRTVEERELGLVRRDDLPGSEAPWAFLDWIRDRSGPVDRVLEHNRLDVLSVAALLGALAPGARAG
jgi:uncharacterized protein YprB with RNaseH-like and TPR domain